MRLFRAALYPTAILTILLAIWMDTAARAEQQRANHLVLPPADPSLCPLIMSVYGDSGKQALLKHD